MYAGRMVEGALFFILIVLVIALVGDWLHDREVDKLRKTFRDLLGDDDPDDRY